MATPDITKVFHNAPYDVGWMLAEGIKVQGPIIDTLIAAPLVDENRFSYRLDLLGKDYIGMRKDEKILKAAAAEWGIDPKAEMWKLPARFVGGYGEQDAVMTLKLWDYLKGEIEKQDLWSVFDLESRVLPAVIDMRATGVPVDLDRAEQSRKLLRDRKKELLSFVKDRTGVEVEVWAADSIKKVFEEQGLPYPRTEAGAPSLASLFLNRVRSGAALITPHKSLGCSHTSLPRCLIACAPLQLMRLLKAIGPGTLTFTRWSPT